MVVRRFLVPLALLCLAAVGPAAAETGGGGSRAAQMGWLDAGVDSACAVQVGGSVLCWGGNSFGQLGDGTVGSLNSFEPAPVPVQLPAGVRATSLSVGDAGACAVLDNGGVECWGLVGLDKQGTPIPIKLPAGSRAVAVSANGYHDCAVLSDGGAWCWGQDIHGALGNGPTVSGTQTTPTRVLLPAGRTAVAITTAFADTCAILDDGSAWCWGYGTDGELGAGPGVLADQESPVRVLLPTGRTAVAISAAGQHVCALLDDGTASCWGDAFRGELGNGTDTGTVSTPATVPTPAPYRVTDISAGLGRTCAALDDRTLTCWGDNTQGTLGVGSAGDAVLTPARVTLPAQRSITGFAAGSGFSCGALDTGGVICWGFDTAGQLGNGAPTAVQKNPALAPFTLSNGTIPGQVADLSLAIAPTGGTQAVGQARTFTVTLRNAGADPATGVRMDLTAVGLRLSGITASQGTVTGGGWSLDLYRGASATLTVTATPTTAGANALTAEVTAAGQVDPDSVPGNHVAGEDDQATVAITTPPPPGTGGSGGTGGQTGGTSGTGSHASRKHPRALSLRVTRLTRTLRVTGVLALPTGATCGGTVTVTARHGRRTAGTARARLHRVARRCTFTGTLRTRATGLTVTARFGGTAALTPITSARRRI
ncbi:MAG: hypothetical protein U0Y82_13165 [Thermoleophilia bacterium]